jgi:hypothetical protein
MSTGKKLPTFLRYVGKYLPVDMTRHNISEDWNGNINFYRQKLHSVNSFVTVL